MLVLWLAAGLVASAQDGEVVAPPAPPAPVASGGGSGRRRFRRIAVPVEPDRVVAPPVPVEEPELPTRIVAAVGRAAGVARAVARCAVVQGATGHSAGRAASVQAGVSVIQSGRGRSGDDVAAAQRALWLLVA